MPLINCEVNIILNWSKYFAIVSSKDAEKFVITVQNVMFQLQRINSR